MENIKRRITAYWTQRVEGFSRLRRRELSGEKGRLWSEELDRYLPADSGLKILDVGTGTGFFSLLLAEKGHQVTGIDLTPSMIHEARQMADKLELAADFLIMDAEEPLFEPRSFDVIVSRNLTWTLPHLGQAYTCWHGLLRPGGLLLNFDADYCREKAADALPVTHAHQGISAELVLEYERMKDVLRPVQQPRPYWDLELLEQAGFCNIAVDTGVWERIYGDVDEFFNPTPIFAISAVA